MESGILGFGIFNSSKGIRNPAKDWNSTDKNFGTRTWNPESKEWHQQSKTVLDYLTWRDTVITYPSPKPKFYAKWEVSVNVGLGEGLGVSFPDTYKWMTIFPGLCKACKLRAFSLTSAETKCHALDMQTGSGSNKCSFINVFILGAVMFFFSWNKKCRVKHIRNKSTAWHAKTASSPFVTSIYSPLLNLDSVWLRVYDSMHCDGRLIQITGNQGSANQKG